MNLSTQEELKIKIDIRALMGAYVKLADAKNWVELASLFTEKGLFETFSPEGKLLVMMNGRREIAMVITESVGRARVIQRLYGFDIQVENDTRAKGVFSMSDTLIRAIDDKPEQMSLNRLPVFRTLQGFGHYHCDYLKIEDRWFIDKLVQTRTKLDFTF